MPPAVAANVARSDCECRQEWPRDLPLMTFPIMMAPSMKTYAGLLLDADNTLFDYDQAEREALLETCKGVAPDIPAATILDTYRPINAAYWTKFEKGLVSVTDLQVGRFSDLHEALHIDADARAVSDSYLLRLSSKAHFMPHAREVLETLASRAALCLVTNGISRVQRGRLAAAGVAAYFKAILISEEVGCAKPDPRFFQKAQAALGLESDQLLCIGDSPAADVAGARAAGIDACWFNPKGAAWPGPGPQPMYMAKDLLEIVKYVGGVFQ
jgi:2-haloacid dehalogenase